jgi:hypothetical protein
VILTEHTRCERGYLPLFARMIREALPASLCEDVRVSTIDDDPLSLFTTTTGGTP